MQHHDKTRKMNQDRDYVAGEKVSLGVRTNAELIAAAHRVAERAGLSTSAWIQSVIKPLIVRELKVDPRVLEAGGGFDCRMPSPLPSRALTGEQRRHAESAARLQALTLDAEQASARLAEALRAAERLGGVSERGSPEPAAKRKKR
jgi:hypothetical protein